MSPYSQVFEQEQQQEPESENKTGVGPQLKKLFEILKTSNAGTEDISSKLGIGNGEFSYRSSHGICILCIINFSNL